jgi:chitinase
VPGLVTIGPNMRIIGQISGLASLHLDASVKLDVVKWDYTQRYPIEGGGNTVKDATIVDEEGDEPEAGAAGTGTSLKPEFFADVKARGSLTVSVYVVFVSWTRWLVVVVFVNYADMSQNSQGRVWHRVPS